VNLLKLKRAKETVATAGNRMVTTKLVVNVRGGIRAQCYSYTLDWEEQPPVGAMSGYVSW
jgi:hypothetical protein